MNVTDLVKEIKSQCNGTEVLGFGNVESGNEAWKEKVREGKMVVLMTTLEELRGNEQERRVLLADNGLLPSCLRQTQDTLHSTTWLDCY